MQAPIHRALIATLTGGFLLVATPALAGSVPQNQEARIEKGQENGQLTRRETRRLNHEQRRLKRQRHRAAADGTITRRERKQMKRSHARSSRHIARAKHNKRRPRR